MPATGTRRPLPAVIFLLVLFLLSFIVWWRVLHRPDASDATPNPSATAAPLVCEPGAHRGLALPQPATISIRVMNGAPARPGLATSITAQLQALGFKQAVVGNNAKQLNRTVDIRYGPSARRQATALSYYLPGAALVPIIRSDAVLDVVLGPKFAGLVPRAIAAASAARAAKAC